MDKIKSQKRRRENVNNENIGLRCNIDTFNGEAIKRFSLGEMEIECKYCSAKGFQSENKGTNKLPHFGILCCNKGKIKLTPFNPLPDKLYNFFTADDIDSKHFRTNIRGYNATLAMASLKINDRTVHTGAPGAFTVSGQMMRRIGPLIPYQKNNPVCIQTYFYDPQEQAKLRAKRLSSSKNIQDQERFERIFFALHSIIIHAENKYLQAFLNLKEFVDNNNLNVKEIRFQLHDTKNPKDNKHRGCYNLPSCTEISILLPKEIPPNANRMMICDYRYSSNGKHGLKFFPDYHRAYDPMGYPLFFPQGDDGWHLDLKSLNTKHTR